MASDPATRPDDAEPAPDDCQSRSDPGGDPDSSTTPRSDRSIDDPYEIAPYEPEHREGYLDLFDSVLGQATDDWFRWKYEDNPYADHVPIVLALDGDQVVGAKPCFPLELRAGGQRVVGYQPADVVVHADHRRRGLYSRTTERMKTRYADGEPSLFFNFPNEATLSGSLKHGWQIVERVPTYYRVQRPAAMLDEDGSVPSRLAESATPLATGYLHARDAMVPFPGDVRVDRYETIPTDVFVDLYERAIPRTLHAHRDETFYEWRFENPRWTYEAFVARRDGAPIAGVVTGSQALDGTRRTHLTEVVPLANRPGRADGLTAILQRALDRHRDADLIAASGRAIDPALLRRFGFHADLAVPTDALGHPTTQVAYPIADDGGHEWTVAGRAITDPNNWTVTFAEQDTA